MSVLEEALAAHARGEVDASALERVARLHSALNGTEKEAAAPTGLGNTARAIGEHVLDILGKSIATTAPMLAASLAVPAAAAVGKTVFDKATRGRDLERILSVYPSIRDHFSPRDIDLAYDSIRHLNPEIARDPLAGGTLLQHILSTRDPSDPRAPQLFQNLAGDLIRLRPHEDNLVQRSAQDAMMRGVGAALDQVNQEKQRNFMDLQNKARQTFEAERDKNKAQFDSRERSADRAWQAQLASDQRRGQQGLETHKAKLREQANERTSDRARTDAQDLEVLRNRLRTAGPDASEMWHEALLYPDTDPQGNPHPLAGTPVLDYGGQPIWSKHTRPPQISDVLYQHYPHLK